MNERLSATSDRSHPAITLDDDATTAPPTSDRRRVAEHKTERAAPMAARFVRGAGAVIKRAKCGARMLSRAAARTSRGEMDEEFSFFSKNCTCKDFQNE
jgi:hypothetical protein